MALLLNIDTAIESASVCLVDNAEILGFAKNDKTKDHASWLHPAIKNIFEESGKKMEEVDAIAVTIGPGSYTGLRIGLSTAKGICYSLTKPLIALNTLQMMAEAAKDEDADLISPMIDARRMEVFTALFDKNLNIKMAPVALVLNEASFQNELSSHKILFFGNGHHKFRRLINSPNAVFGNISADAKNMINLSDQKFRQKEFDDLAYIEPLYLKEFYTSSK